MPEHRVGIVIPSYNSGDLVLEAAESARAGLGSLDNVVVVDDGSTHRRSREALDGLAASGFTVHRQANAGVSAARNRGLALLTTQYAFVLDSDDLIGPAAATTAANALDAHPDVVIVAGAGIDFRGSDPKDEDPPRTLPELTREDMWHFTRIATASAFRVDGWAACGGFPEDVAVGEDWVFWLRLLHGGGRILSTDEIFVRHRIHAEQTTRGYIDPRESAKAANLVLRENADLALARPDELVDELVTVRSTLAAYRHAYRSIDRLKSRARHLGESPSRLLRRLR